METERLRTLATRWGLVALGALSVVVVRFLGDFLEAWSTLRIRSDWRVLAARMSQLKPHVWKAQTSGPVAIALASVLALVILTLFVLGLRDALRPKEDGEGPG